MNRHQPRTRRALLQRGATIAAAIATTVAPQAAWANNRPGTRLRKVIPSSLEQIAPIGMGTWITFNVGRDRAVLAQRAQVLRAFFAAGGGMIDSSPMYGSAQRVVGELLTQLQPDNLFSATKVWTGSGGRAQIAHNHALWRLKKFDLLQVHNLLSWQDHLPLLQQMKADGQLRYVGVTTSHGRRHRDLEKLMTTETLDFVQLTYNAVDREVENRLLPLAVERGIAVIANRPFRRGSLPERMRGRPLPGFAASLQCQTWAELLLKFVVSHPVITCAIPATSQVAHMRQNMAAGTGPQPDDALRRAIGQVVADS